MLRSVNLVVVLMLLLPFSMMGSEMANVGAFSTVQLMEKSKSGKLEAPTATLEVPEGVMKENLEISLSSIGESQLPKLDRGMTNVTDSFSGYRFLPHGEHFGGEGAKVVLGYDRTKIPSGYTEDDIRTYYYDEQQGHWIALERDSVDRAHRVIVSHTTHFTDMINGVIQAPESPETQGFAPTMMSDLQAADPTAKVQMIQAPQANSSGTASLSYSLEMPPARNGMAPNLSIQYSSDAGSGWLGEGWNLTTSSISVDTRWGVPRYNLKNETETYLLDGQMLLEDGIGLVHRNSWKGRLRDTVRFYPRKEGAFSEIVRVGDKPSNYIWVVTDRRGTKYTYGAYKITETKDEYGDVTRDTTIVGVLKNQLTRSNDKEKDLQIKKNEGVDLGDVISEWKLTRIEEIHGDYVEYEYEEGTSQLTPKDKVVELYLSRVSAGNKGEKPHTEVRLISDKKKKISRVNGNYGFLSSSNKLLTSVEVYFEGSLLRKYGFEYADGAFATDLLSSINQYDLKGNLFNSHKLNYHNNYNGNLISSEPVKCETGNDIKSFFPPITQDYLATALGGTYSSSISFNTYAGVGPVDASPSKSNTGGISYVHRRTDSEGVVSMVDLDGDGLPDKVFSNGLSVFYRKQLPSSTPGSAPAFAEAVPVPGLKLFSSTTSRSNSFGGKGHVGWGDVLVVGGIDYTSSSTVTNVYFTDVNADGLVDVVYHGRVYFNKMDNGVLTFSEGSFDTKNPIIQSGKIISIEDDEDSKQERIQEQEDMINSSPMQDIVRVWKAPRSGNVKITGDASYIVRDVEGEPQDGVYVSIQTGDKVLKAKQLSGANGSNKFSLADGVSANVKKDQMIFFRVQSGQDRLSNGWHDEVEWHPTVTYVDGVSVNDANGRDVNVYESEKAFLVSGQVTYGLKAGKQDGETLYKGVYLNGSFKKPVTSDDVTVRVVLNSPKKISVCKQTESVKYCPEYKTASPDCVLGEEDMPTREECAQYESVDNPDYMQEVIFEKTFGKDEVVDMPIDLGGMNILNYKGKNDKGEDVLLDNVSFYVKTNTNVAFDEIEWTPVLHYELADGVQESYAKDDYCLVDYSVYSKVLSYSNKPFVLPELSEEEVENFVVTPSMGIAAIGDAHTLNDFIEEAKKLTNLMGFPFLMSIKGENGKYNKQYHLTYDFSKKAFEPERITPFTADEYTPNDKVWIELYSELDNVDLKFQLAFRAETKVDKIVVENGQTKHQVSKEETVDVSAYSRTSDGFGPMYMGWGQFGYTVTGDKGKNMLDESKMDVSKLVDEMPKDDDGNVKADELSFDNMPVVFLRPDAQRKAWLGQDPDNTYLTNDVMRSSRLGEQDVVLTDPLEDMRKELENVDLNSVVKGTNAYAFNLVSKTSSLTELAGASHFTGQNSNGWGGSQLSYTDVNGDGYPDIVLNGAIQYTNPLGGYTGGGIYRGKTSLDYSKSHAFSLGAGMTTTPSRPTNAKNGQQGAKDAALAQSSSEKSQVNLSVGLGVYSQDETEVTLMDINGDGLPDKVRTDDGEIKVRLNLGYSFTLDEVVWGKASIRKSRNNDLNLGFGVDVGATSFSFGIGVSATFNRVNEDIRDVNGDGLPDYVDGRSGIVKMNMGCGFESNSSIPWDTKRAEGWLSSSFSASKANNGTATTSVPVFLVKVTGSGGGAGSSSMNGELLSYRDMDGDGFMDYVTASMANEDLNISYSRIGATNKLQSVTNPFGGKFTIEYAHTTPTTDHPGGKWAMSALTVDDATGMNPAMKTTFSYENGKRDRREREFLGFGKVTTTNLDEQGNPVRSVIAEYDVQHYLTAGVPIRNLVVSPGTEKDEKGNLVNIKHKEDITAYAHYTVTDGSQLKTVNIDDITEETSLFSAPKAKKTIVYEANDQNGLELTTERFDYTENYGNLSAYSFRDLPQDMKDNWGYDDVIQYSDQRLGLATSVEVKGTDGTLYRKVTAEYKDKRTPTAMTQMVQHLDGGKKAEFTFKYDQYGNMVRRTFPTEGATNEEDRSFFEYEYDRKYHMYPERVTDAFGYHSEMEDYDYRYGIPRTVRDMNGYTVRYYIDDFGRVDTIVAPNEQSDGVPYTISYKYVLGGDYKSSFALTNHYDPQHPNNPLQTVTHVDGLGRPYQVKKDAEIQGEGEKMIVSGRTQYDALGRTIKTYHPTTCALADATKIVGFNDKLLNSSTFDAIDRPLTQTLPGDESNDEKSRGDAVSKMNYSIEEGLMKITTIDPRGNEQYAYANGAGQTVRTARDYKKMKDEESESMEEKVYAINYAYDPIGQLLSVTDAGGNVTSYSYDMAGRKLSVEHPSAGLTTFAYDVAGNVVEKQTPNLAKEGASIQYIYKKNRLEGVKYPNHPGNNVTYTYGGVNAPHNRVGRLALIEDGSGATEFFYGRMGEVTKQRRTLVIPNQAVATYTTEWTYDSHNRIQTMTYPDGEVVSYRYNLGGLLSSVSGKKDYTYDYVEEIGYDEYEQRKYMKYGNGVETTYDYSKERRRLDTLVVMNQEGKIMDNAYFYDNLDNITKLVNKGKAQKTKDGKTIGGGVTHDYTYDAWNRLIEAHGTFGGADDKSAKYDLFMAYDEFYNVTSKKLNVEQTNLQFPGTLKAGHTLKYQYDRENNDPFRLLSVSASEYRVAVEEGEDPEAPVEEDKMVKTRSEYAFDANGNQSQVATGKEAKEGVEELPQANLRQLHWDEENRLLAINDNGHVSSYFYDANGERTVKMSAGMEDLFINGSRPIDEKEFDAKFVAYVSPYLVLKNGGEYTKHIYAGTERIASKIGDFESFGADPRRVEKAGESIREISYKDKYDALGKQLAENYDTFKVACNLKENKDYEDNASFCCGDKPLEQMEENDPSSVMENTKAEANIFFYHPDHLGSTSLVTNLDGEVTQHVSYIPYGEVFIEERNGVWSTPYLFNAKELDEETGLYYYGARYLNPKDARWLSVDPMFENFTGVSPYAYCHNNPISRVDPNGMFDSQEDAEEFARNQELLDFEVFPTEEGDYEVYDFTTGTSYIDGGMLEPVDCTPPRTLWDKIWYSTPMRGILPDIITVSVGGDCYDLFGGGISFELNFFLRGEGASPLPLITCSPKLGVETGGSASVNLCISRKGYSGDAHDLKRNMLLGETVWGQVSVPLIPGFSAEGGLSYSPLKNGKGIFSMDTQVSYGVSLQQESLTVGVSYTMELCDTYKKFYK